MPPDLTPTPALLPVTTDVLERVVCSDTHASIIRNDSDSVHVLDSLSPESNSGNVYAAAEVEDGGSMRSSLVETMKSEDEAQHSVLLTTKKHDETRYTQRENLQQDFSEASTVMETARGARRPRISCTWMPVRDGMFFGRDETLSLLDEVFEPSETYSPDRAAHLDLRRIALLRGDPGVGKSAIASEWMYRIAPMFDYIFWIRAGSESHLAQSFHEAAVSLGLVQARADYNHEISRKKLLGWLSNATRAWLMVFDDANQLQMLSESLPDLLTGSVLVTSRQSSSQDFAVRGDGRLHTIDVGPFHAEDAIPFLHSLMFQGLEVGNNEAQNKSS